MKNKNKKNIVQEIIYLFNHPYKKIKYVQLMDGMVLIYDKHNILCKFKYTGGKCIWNTELNLPHRGKIGFCGYKKLHLIEKNMEDSSKLLEILQNKFPKAHLCDARYKNCYEFSIIEVTINDKTTEIEIEQNNKNNIKNKKYNFYLINNENYVSCSFKITEKCDNLLNIFLRCHGHSKDIKLNKINIPKHKQYIFKKYIDEFEINLINNTI